MSKAKQSREVIALSMTFCSVSVAQAPSPKNGFLPDERTAITVAEAMLIPIFGKSQVENERPFTAKLENNVWTVTGTLRNGWQGGTAVIHLNKSTGAFISYIHYK